MYNLYVFPIFLIKNKLMLPISCFVWHICNDNGTVGRRGQSHFKKKENENEQCLLLPAYVVA